MSFGAAASARRGGALADQAPCPCGRGRFGTCCGPVLAGEAATSPEDLMRSRYTAFALGDERHLEATWFPASRPGRVDVDPDTRWVGLEILDAAEASDGRSGTVRFRAHWREGQSGRSGVLEERSRFVKRLGRWYYVEAL